MAYDSVKLDSRNVLLCPNCNGSYLHHDLVRVYGRVHEDDLNLVKVTVETTQYGDRTFTPRKPDHGNPSGRRDGLAVRFWCEFCAAVSELTIFQHKGETFLEWREIEGVTEHHDDDEVVAL